MPGANVCTVVHQCYPDVGGVDVWVGAEFDAHARWWVGWHSPKALETWWHTKPNAWSLIGWEHWVYAAYYPDQVHYNAPNPSTTPRNQHKVPQSAWNATYDDNDNLIQFWSSAPMPLDADIWHKGTAPSKGKGKGNEKGKNMGNGKGKA